MSIIEDVTKKGSPYYSRRATDKLFELPCTHYTYEGVYMDTVNFIKKKQLLDAPLWALFVEQFRGTPDDHDRGWRCEYWGKMMRGACFTYQVTNDEQLYATLTDTIIDMLSAQDEDGRFSTYSKEVEFSGWDLWGRKYVMLGFQYYWEICRDEVLKKRIIEAISRHADYIISRIGYENQGKLPIVKTSNFWGGVNSSSILEPMMRLYNTTGKNKYLDFSSYLVNCGGCDGLNLWETAYENNLAPYQLPVRKAYEIMSYFEGILEFYRVSRVEKYRIAVLNFVNSIIKTEVTIIGSAGCEGEFFNNAKMMQFSSKIDDIMQETCVTVTWMKLCSAMLALTGDSVFADQIETAALNAIRGSINTEDVQHNGGLPFDSYTPTRAGIRGRSVGGQKTIEGNRFYGCCACIGSAGPAVYFKNAVMSAAKGIVVNFYSKARINTYSPDGHPFAMIIDTDYPKSGRIVIGVTCESEQPTALYLRIPRWSAETTVSIDGVPVERVKNNSYLKILRVWTTPARIEIDLDMRTKMIKSVSLPDDSDAANHCAIRRGPLVMARDARLHDNVDEAREILCDKNKYVDAFLSDGADFDTLVTLNLPTADGGVLTVCDCSSAGKTWDEKSKMAIWMKTKEYGK
ncbi:MAG: glycoside hydrolase family 127 protein [Clostridia bacterium]|nr:glycoside hydrolase family 127 protein [Clostridia bacterium]